MAKKAAGSRKRKIGRDSRSGEFESVAEAKKHPETSVVETLPTHGYKELHALANRIFGALSAVTREHASASGQRMCQELGAELQKFPEES
jgi:hypothetical protein